MSRLRNIQVEAWPRIKPLPIENAAAMIGVARETLERICKRLEINPDEKINTRNSLSIPVAKLYLTVGRNGVVVADKLYKLLNTSPEEILGVVVAREQEEAEIKRQKEAKQKASGKEKKQRNALMPVPSPEELDQLSLGQLKEDWTSAVNRDTGARPWGLLRSLAAALGRKGQRISCRLDGIAISSFAVSQLANFECFADFLRVANPQDRWPFIVPDRTDHFPIDLLSARPEDFESGVCFMLTMEQWHTLNAQSLSERNNLELVLATHTELDEDDQIKSGTPKLSGKKWGSQRMSNKD